MRLLVMRHGIAERPQSNDFSRNLSPEGIAGVKRSAECLQARGLIPDIVYVSPLVRAQQTAKIMIEALCSTPGLQDQKMQTLEELRPESDVGRCYRRLVGLIEDKKEKELCLLVSHQPLVSLFVDYLTSVEVYMDTADIICISMDNFARACGEIEWHRQSY